MPLDQTVAFQPATRADVAQVALKAARLGVSLRFALLRISKGMDIDQDDKEIETIIKEFDDLFDELTGWRPEE